MQQRLGATLGHQHQALRQGDDANGVSPEAGAKSCSRGQRTAIASAVIPMADEPTSALDVSIQAQVLNLFMDLQEEFNTAYVFVSHNLAVVEHVANDLMVMYLGRAVEVGAKGLIFERPLHPYTQALLSATPSIDRRQRRVETKITGEPPFPHGLCARNCYFLKTQPHCRPRTPWKAARERSHWLQPEPHCLFSTSQCNPFPPFALGI